MVTLLRKGGRVLISACTREGSKLHMSQRTICMLALPAYRREFLLRLLVQDETVRVMAGMHGFDIGVKTPSEFLGIVEQCPQCLFGPIGVQRVLFHSAGDVVVHDLNPRVATTWLTLLLRVFTKHRVLLWGHVAGGRRRKRLRRLMLRKADGVVAYTEIEREQFLIEGAQKAFLAPNATRSVEGSPVVRPRKDRSGFVWLGRMVPGKNPLLAAAAYKIAVLEGVDTQLHPLRFVGDGPEMTRLKKFCRDNPDLNIYLHGEDYESTRVDELVGQSIASLITGYAGLNVMDSLWNGTAVILIDGGVAHSPEHTLVVNGVNGFRAASKEKSDFAAAITRAIDANFSHLEIGAVHRRLHSAEAMVDGMLLAMADAE